MSTSVPSLSVPSNVDVAVIGGGSAGLGVARAFVEHGRSVVVFEGGRCGGATSANSLRIVHGGFRYLQSFDLPRVIESIRAAAALRREFPHLVAPLPCVMPLDRVGLKSRFPLGCARRLYRVLTRLVVGATPAVTLVNGAAIEAEVPLLRGRAPYGALVWTDGLMSDPEALIGAVCASIRARGGVIVEESRVVEVLDRGDDVAVTVAGGDRTYTVTAGLVVDASGPWVGSVTHLGVQVRPEVVGWARAFNVVVGRSLDRRYGITLPGEGRLLFAVPRGDGSAIGTGYLLPAADGGSHIAEREVAAFLIEASRSLAVPLTLKDVVAVESGRLPMVGQRGEAPVLLGRERIVRRGRIVAVTSTKYTTFQEQGRAVYTLSRDLFGRA